LSGGGGSAKIPLYAGMTATFLSITRRGTEVFGKSMYWVPFFCIVINLSFIFALDTVQYGNAVVDPVTGIKELTDLNYILHICHDILGTEMGVLVFGLLIKNYVPVAQRVEE
jgi:type III secretory pathway component EscU